MNPTVIRFEEVDFEELMPFRVKRERAVFWHRRKPLVVKLFAADWEFANQVALGYESGVYDERLVPNMEALIKDEHGRNRGYIMKRIPAGKILDNFCYSTFSVQRLRKAVTGEIRINDILSRRERLRPKALLEMLQLLLERAEKTGLLFAEFSPPNIWVSKKGYHLLDLDALRPLEWLMCKDTEDAEFIRKLVNRLEISDNLNNLLRMHGLKSPGRLHEAHNPAVYWKAIKQSNHEYWQSHDGQ
jgi:hypothetical protein